MKDNIHAALKWISYNRNTVFFGIVVLLVVAMGFIGCQPTAAWNGNRLTEAEINMEVATRTAEIEAATDEAKLEASKLLTEANQYIQQAATITEAADKAAQRDLSLLTAKATAAKDEIEAKWQQWEGLISLGVNLGNEAATGNLTPALIMSGITGALGLLFGRRDKKRTDEAAAMYKAKAEGKLT